MTVSVPTLTFHAVYDRDSGISFPLELFARGMALLHHQGYKTVGVMEAQRPFAPAFDSIVAITSLESDAQYPVDFIDSGLREIFTERQQRGSRPTTSKLMCIGARPDPWFADFLSCRCTSVLIARRI